MKCLITPSPYNLVYRSRKHLVLCLIAASIDLPLYLINYVIEYVILYITYIFVQPVEYSRLSVISRRLPELKKALYFGNRKKSLLT